ncbi:MAG: hypothetical protein HG467_004245 [Clostridiales bacterium]|nr:hypothetical protein [Clostridiales bacterium]
MQDTVITIIAILVAGVLLFIFPIMAVAERNNDISQSITEKAVADFVTEVASSGSITSQNYSKLVNTLSTTGNTYDVEMEVKKIDENVGKKSQWVNNKVIGENQQYSINTSQISESLKNRGVYNLKAGDTFSVKVKNSNKTLAQNFRSLINPAGTDKSEISAQESSVVTATGAR